MHSQAVALPTTTPADYANALEQRITSGELSLDELAQIADDALMFHNVLARARIIAERQIAQQYLFDNDEYTENVSALRQRGWTPYRITSALKFVQLTIPEVVEHAERHTAAQKEAPVAGARVLAPVSDKPERKGIAQSFSVPPIDIQIAREFGMDAADSRAELLTQSIHRALQTMDNPKHAHVFTKYHGIQQDGTLGDHWTFDGIAKNMPDGRTVSREYVEGLYYRASTRVFQTIAADALSLVKQLQLAA